MKNIELLLKKTLYINFIQNYPNLQIKLIKSIIYLIYY